MITSTETTGCCTRQTLPEFLAALDAFRDRIPLEELRQRMAALDIEFDEVRRVARFSNERYQRNLLHAGPAYQALVLCWQPGQRSPIHDHTGSSCGVRVLKGVATETVFDRTPDGHIFPTLTHSLAIDQACATQDSDIHQVSNLQREQLVTLHVYSPPLLCMNVYSLTDASITSMNDPIFTGADGEGI